MLKIYGNLEGFPWISRKIGALFGVGSIMTRVLYWFPDNKLVNSLTLSGNENSKKYIEYSGGRGSHWRSQTVRWEGSKNHHPSNPHNKTRWWFQIFFIFTPTWGNDPSWLIFFKGVETTNQKKIQLSTTSTSIEIQGCHQQTRNLFNKIITFSDDLSCSTQTDHTKHIQPPTLNVSTTSTFRSIHPSGQEGQQGS